MSEQQAQFEGREQDESCTNGVQVEAEYGSDALKMVETLPETFPASVPDSSRISVVFLTVATDFLGSFILKDLLDCKAPAIKKIIVLVRAKDENTAMARIKVTCQAHGIWSDSWESRIQCVAGNLSPTKLGLSDDIWKQIVEETDIAIHN